MTRLGRWLAALTSAAVVVGVLVFWSQTVIAATCNVPPDSTTPVGACPPASSLAPLQGASSQTLDISNLFWAILVLSGIVFIPVMAALIVNIVRFTHHPGDDEEPKQIYGSRRIEIAWTALPAGILLITFILTVIVMNQVDAPARAQSALKVEAIGHQWWWQFRIPQYHIVTANEFHVPVNTLVEIETTSVDVIHSFWVPQLSRQIDATPNIKTYVYITASKTGVFPGACYEFCGQGHAWMQFRVTVDQPANSSNGRGMRLLRRLSPPPLLPSRVRASSSTSPVAPATPSTELLPTARSRRTSPTSVVVGPLVAASWS